MIHKDKAYLLVFSTLYEKKPAAMCAWSTHHYSQLQEGWHGILRFFLELYRQPELRLFDLRLVLGNKTVLIIHPMRILIRLVLKSKKLQVISRVRATLSAIGCTMCIHLHVGVCCAPIRVCVCDTRKETRVYTFTCAHVGVYTWYSQLQTG